MSIFSGSEYTSLLIAVSTMVLIQAVVFYLYKQNKESKYNDQNRRIEMEKLRESMEKRIYDLTERLLSREDRWRDVNHLLVESKSNEKEIDHKVKKVKENTFLSSSGLKGDDYQIENDFVFVITPFNEKYNKDYEVIADICSDVGLKCARGDEEYIEGDILSHILKKIVKSRVVIANINGRNPNVFYELGLAHALEKPTLITSKSIEDIPFDLRSKQIVIYKDSNDFKDQLSKALIRLSLRGA